MSLMKVNKRTLEANSNRLNQPVTTLNTLNQTVATHNTVNQKLKEKKKSYLRMTNLSFTKLIDVLQN